MLWSVRVHVAFAGSQDYRVWGRALCKDPISTFFPSATPNSLIVWPQTKYFETTPSQASSGCFVWARTRRFGRDRSGFACSPSQEEGKQMGLFGNLRRWLRRTLMLNTQHYSDIDISGLCKIVFSYQIQINVLVTSDKKIVDIVTYILHEEALAAFVQLLSFHVFFSPLRLFLINKGLFSPTQGFPFNTSARGFKNIEAWSNYYRPLPWSIFLDSCHWQQVLFIFIIHLPLVDGQSFKPCKACNWPAYMPMRACFRLVRF